MPLKSLKCIRSESTTSTHYSLLLYCPILESTTVLFNRRILIFDDTCLSVCACRLFILFITIIFPLISLWQNFLYLSFNISHHPTPTDSIYSEFEATLKGVTVQDVLLLVEAMNFEEDNMTTCVGVTAPSPPPGTYVRCNRTVLRPVCTNAFKTNH